MDPSGFNLFYSELRSVGSFSVTGYKDDELILLSC